MRISEASHHLKKTSLWDNENQTEAENEISTPDILSKATATIRASLGVNNPQDIWDALGLYLEKQLIQHQAINITDFGAFGFDHNDEPVFVQDPVFLHMARLCLASRKRGNAVQPALSQSESIDVVDLNELAAEYLQNCAKDQVKSVISSVLAWLVAWAKDGQEMRLSFLPVGEWICVGDSVDFKFSESFRKELELKNPKKNELAVDIDSGDNNQFEGHDEGGDQFVISPLSAQTTNKSNASFAKGKLSVDTSVSAAKEAAARNGSPASRSRYKLRTPTFSSISKQLPPHGQRRNRTDSQVKGPTSSKSKTKASSSKKSARSRAAPPNRGPVSPTINPTELEAAAKEILDAVKNSCPATTASSRACNVNQSSKIDSQPTVQQMETIDRLRRRISNRRSKTMQGLNAVMVVMSPFKTGAISSAELSLSLRKLGVKVSSAELKEVAAAFAHEKRGYIDIRKFVDALRGPPLSPERLDLVARVFHQMDPACTGSVHIDEMIKHYDVGFLPEVRNGKQSRLEALTVFLQEWACINTATANTITFDTFAEYYHNVSACIDNDDGFTRLMHQAWHIPEEDQEKENQPSADENRKPMNSTVTSSIPGAFLPMSSHAENVSESPAGDKTMLKEETSPSEAWAFLRALLLFPYEYQYGAHTWPTSDNMCRRLGANRVLGDGNETMNVKAFANALTLLNKRLTHKKAYQLSHFVADHCGKSVEDNETIVLLSLYRTLMATPTDTSVTQPAMDYNYIEYHASRAIERIRARVKGLQTNSNKAENTPLVDLNTLEKWLQVSSSNGDSLLLKYELRSALMKVGIDITYQDLDYLFAYFDVERQGFISYEIFLEAVRSPSNVLPKLIKRRENHVETPEQTLSDPIQPTTIWATAVSAQPVQQRKQITTREPEPNYRRRNQIHRAIWDQTKRPNATDTFESFNMVEIERRIRYRAARLIQTMFRGFHARQIVAQLRRKVAAKKYRFNALAQERQQWLANRKKVYRTALPTAYGF